MPYRPNISGNRISQIVVATLVVAGSLLSVTSNHDHATNKNNGKQSIDIAFITHLDAQLPEQDVYIEREAGSGEVLWDDRQPR